MKRLLAPVILILLAWSAQLAAAPVIGMDDPNRVPDQYIVVFKADKQGNKKKDKTAKHAAKAEALAIKHQAKIERKFQRSLEGFVARIPKGQLKKMAADPGVEYIEADRIVQLEATQAPATWGLDRIDQHQLPLDNSYSYTGGASEVNVYIIDTGIRASHTEFAGRAHGAYSVINDGRGSNDCNGHGTHVAGTVGGASYGVAKEVNLHAVRVMDCRGRGYLSGVIAGVDWVTSHHDGPAVANMSLGGGSSRSLDTAVRNAVAAGVTFVVAAGNANADACNYSPARVDQAVTVGATSSSDSRASFSNWGSCVDLFAPGTSITSAWYSGDTALARLSGTSMASPHVAGIAALYLAGHPDASPAQVSENLVDSASSGQLSGMTGDSPNKLAYSVIAANEPEPVPETPPATCPAGYEVYSGNLTFSGDSEYQPNGRYYFSASGTHDGRLIGPAGSDFDLYLWRWNGRFWQTVSSATSADTNESISYDGSSGYYAWRVVSSNGGGEYQFCLSRP